jgi:hypothetical protein
MQLPANKEVTKKKGKNVQKKQEVAGLYYRGHRE